jgi:hypothetical protein
MTAVDALEAEAGGQFIYRWGGQDYTLVAPAELSWHQLVRVIRDPILFVVELAHAHRLTIWQIERLRDDWMTHHGLGAPSSVERLAYMIEHYRDAIEYDLDTLPGPHPPFGELWRTRQVRRLLNLIDHLPPNCHTNAAVASNDDHVRLMIEAGLKPAKGVSQVYYGSIEQRLDDIVDALGALRDVTIAVNSGKGKRNPPTKPRPRPTSAFSRVRHQTRMAQHESLMARLFGPDGPQPEAPQQPRVAGQRRRDRRVLDGTAVVDPLGTTAFVKAPAAQREEERAARWKDRAAEVGRVPRESTTTT